MKKHFLHQFFLFLIYGGLVSTGSLFAETAYVQASSFTTQVPSSGAGILIKMESVDQIKNFEISPTKDRIVTVLDGTYYVSVAAQAGATTPGASGYLDIWIEKNGKPLFGSTNRQSIVSGNFTAVLNTQFIIHLSQGDTLGTKLIASGPSIGLIYIKPDAEPAITSFIFSLIKID